MIDKDLLDDVITALECCASTDPGCCEKCLYKEDLNCTHARNKDVLKVLKQVREDMEKPVQQTEQLDQKKLVNLHRILGNLVTAIANVAAGTYYELGKETYDYICSTLNETIGLNAELLKEGK